MYIVLKKNKNTNNIIESLKTFGEKIEVKEKYHCLFVEMDTSSSSTIWAYVSFTSKDLCVTLKEDSLNYFTIDFKDLLTILSL